MKRESAIQIKPMHQHIISALPETRLHPLSTQQQQLL
jgi:hypothetical protein